MATSAIRRADEETCRDALKFVTIYNESADLRREKMGLLYSSNQPTLVFNGNSFTGVQQIQDFWNGLPSTEHDLRCCDAQKLPSETEKMLLVQNMGNVTINGLSHGYSQTLFLIFEDGNYRIKSDRYRFID